jgi:heat shock protein HslJ
MKFEAENSRVGGNGSCNRFGGSFLLNNDSLTFSQLFSTKMYCADVQQTEDKFLSTLQKVNRFNIQNDHLVLLKDSTILLEFMREKE